MESGNLGPGPVWLFVLAGIYGAAVTTIASAVLFQRWVLPGIALVGHLAIRLFGRFAQLVAARREHTNGAPTTSTKQRGG